MDPRAKASFWRLSGNLPSASRGFDFLMPSGIDAEDEMTPADERFIVPSYLRGNTYVQRLEEQRKAKLLAPADSRHSMGHGSAGSPASGGGALPQPASHRGLTYSLVERSPVSEPSNDLAPLPTRWSKDDMWTNLEIQSDHRCVRHVGPKNLHERDYESSSVRANHPIPPQCGIFYFEVEILSSRRDDTTIAIGYLTSNCPLSRPLGWEPETCGYHGDDGRCFVGSNLGAIYGPSFDTGDVIGCGINFRDHTCFFTKNGCKLSTACRQVPKGKLFPAVSLKMPGEHISCNFGHKKFLFNIDDVMKMEQQKITEEIQAVDTSRLELGMKETDLVQSLVLQFLQHEGYVETARNFADEMRARQEALNMDPEASVTDIQIRDDQDAVNRQRIRQAILEGDIDRALKNTNAYYPQVLQNNEDVSFKLRCRKFIEMVRRAAQLRAAMRSTNGHAPGPGLQAMDVDARGNEALGSSLQPQVSAELMTLEQNMLDYGQSLQAEYARNPRKEITSALGEIWALVAYTNPLQEPSVSHLLDKQGRATAAEELNSAILSSLGKSSRAALEKLYAQTTVLLDDLGINGDVGAFVSMQNVMSHVHGPQW
ncbi:hypothetical protein CDD81_5313 [Ophiocordyceps australis]|uniref:Uncharacterized protein n=1 Tax=Ophiocordyceps australis TaxID=1399860 RepID=A0A2C5YJ79_9HYPO|nr:hypothetical protein CDD81_5313 [Ophiocordyceps australis]